MISDTPISLLSFFKESLAKKFDSNVNRNDEEKRTIEQFSTVEIQKPVLYDNGLEVDDSANFEYKKTLSKKYRYIPPHHKSMDDLRKQYNNQDKYSDSFKNKNINKYNFKKIGNKNSEYDKMFTSYLDICKKKKNTKKEKDNEIKIYTKNYGKNIKKNEIKLYGSKPNNNGKENYSEYNQKIIKNQGKYIDIDNVGGYNDSLDNNISRVENGINNKSTEENLDDEVKYIGSKIANKKDKYKTVQNKLINDFKSVLNNYLSSNLELINIKSKLFKKLKKNICEDESLYQINKKKWEERRVKEKIIILNIISRNRLKIKDIKINRSATNTKGDMMFLTLEYLSYITELEAPKKDSFYIEKWNYGMLSMAIDKTIKLNKKKSNEIIDKLIEYNSEVGKKCYESMDHCTDLYNLVVLKDMLNRSGFDFKL